MSRPAPLSGYVVLDLTRFLAGPFCTMLLADMGADVIKVEQPGAGDPGRKLGPFTEDGMSSYFVRMNRGKRSIALDTRSPEGRKLMLKLCKSSDAVVSNLRPGVLEAIGLGPDTLREANPALIVATLSGFGDENVRPTPFAGAPSYDIVVMAMGGLLHLIGEEDGRPLWPGFGLGDLVPAVFTAFGIACSLADKQRRSHGARLDVAMADCMVAMAENAMTRWMITGHEYGRGAETIVAPYSSFEAKDGYVAIAVVQESEWRGLCEALHREDWLARPELNTPMGRVAARNELREVIEAWTGSRTRAEATEALTEAGVPAGPVRPASEVTAAADVRARNMIVGLAREDGPPIPAVGTPLKYEGVDDESFQRPPKLGEHSREVLRDLLGMDAVQVEELIKSGVLG